VAELGDLRTFRLLVVKAQTDERINLTDLRRVALGDRWDGEISIAKNTIRVVTTRKGPDDETGARATMTIVGEEAVNSRLGIPLEDSATRAGGGYNGRRGCRLPPAGSLLRT
jgi:hypothetical protein